MHLQSRYIAIIILLLVSHLAGWGAVIVVHGTPNWRMGVDIAEHVQFYEDKARKPLILSQIQTLKTFQPYAQKRDERRTDSDVAVIRTWLKFEIQNTHLADTAHLVYWMGAHARAFLYRDSMLVFKAGLQHVTTGYVPHVNFLDVEVPPNGTHTFWLQVIDYESSPMPIMAQLHTQHTATRMFAITENNYKLLFLLMSLIAGCLLFMTLYSLYHFWLTRDVIFGYYTLYVASALVVTWLGIEGRFQLSYLTSLFNNNDDKGFEIISFNFVVPIFYILFVAKITDTPQAFPRIWMILKGMIGVLVVQQMLLLYQTHARDYFYSNTYYLNKNLVGLLATLLLLYTTLRSKTPIKPYLLAGITCFVIFVFMPMFLNFFTPKLSHRPDIEAVINLTMFWVFFGLALEALFFSFALAYRNRLVEIEKNQMQTRYAEQLERQLIFRTKEIQAQDRLLEEQRVRQLESDFEQRIAETEMTALRAQMNPHFIFNCLNSIKLYTLENNALAASEYLTKFSRLIRLVLENSRSEKVTLENELETLKLYIEMEAMRFKDKVRYKIEVAEEIDPQYVEIPPLLLQPYVENAIWHGLMHKAKGGTVQIVVGTVEAGHALSLQVVITDDGIGRAAAAELKSKSAAKNKSFGLKMTSERIELINQLYKTQTQVKIEDLAVGTRVTIEIPI